MSAQASPISMSMLQQWSSMSLETSTGPSPPPAPRQRHREPLQSSWSQNSVSDRQARFNGRMMNAYEDHRLASSSAVGVGV